MRTAFIVCLLTAVTAVPAAAQKEKARAREPKKGDVVIVNGCLTGQALQATDIRSSDSPGTLPAGITFRLTGTKTVLKALRDEHNARLVEVEGILKSDLPKESGAAGKIGNMRITVGTPSAGTMAQQTETGRSLPVLDVKSFSGSTVVCGR